MGASLVLTPEQARSVIEMSEGKPGLKGAKPGHTKSRHIQISREGLADRMQESDPPDRPGGKIFWRAAFLDINSAAKLLAETIAALGATEFVSRFDRQEDGQSFSAGPVVIGPFDCRDQRGRFPACQVSIAMQKMIVRPHGLHLITFYPTIAL